MRQLATTLVTGLMLAASTLAVAADTLPLGDGMISSSPKQVYIYSCQTRFRGGGAHGRGEWVRNDAWDRSRKPLFDGQFQCPGASITITREGTRRVIRANNLPTHPTGIFPIRPNDPAYRYDRNPNAVAEQDIFLTLPAEPSIADSPSCVPMGMIGVSLTGAAIFNTLDATGRDAPAHEMQDACSGHPERSGQYHYHDYSSCLADNRSLPGGHSDLVGYASTALEYTA